MTIKSLHLTREGQWRSSGVLRRTPSSRGVLHHSPLWTVSAVSNIALLPVKAPAWPGLPFFSAHHSESSDKTLSCCSSLPPIAS